MTSSPTELRGTQVTELYTKAADQLGSDKAPVRLAGLYALERLAQDNPGQRQTIVNVICAYFQMPYTPPGSAPVEPPVESPSSAEGAVVDEGTRADVEQERHENRRQDYEKRAQERRVRTTARRILHRHLTKTPSEQLRWNTTVDLS
ncbi:MAG TPA: hypothetical protein VNT24_04110, partial [Propionibacteriaceae bacterium]|nr:hypothetical protein [Propionibacteriaceae bacterium]